MDEEKKVPFGKNMPVTKSSKIREKLFWNMPVWSRLLPEDWECILGYTVEYDDLVGYGIFV